MGTGGLGQGAGEEETGLGCEGEEEDQCELDEDGCDASRFHILVGDARVGEFCFALVLEWFARKLCVTVSMQRISSRRAARDTYRPRKYMDKAVNGLKANGESNQSAF